MNALQLLRDNAGMAAFALIIGWSGNQLHELNTTAGKLSESLIEMKTIQGFHSFRLDKQADKMVAIETRQNDLRSDVSRIQERMMPFKK